MKPTQIRCSEGSVNQIPPWTEIQGDIRLTPFYDAETCLEKVKGYVETLNNGEERGERVGPEREGGERGRVGPEGGGGERERVCVFISVSDLSLLPTRGPCSKYILDIPEVIMSSI